MTVAELARPRAKKTIFPWGAVQGSIALAPALLQRAKECAAEQYRAAEEEEFCGDAVRDVLVPSWMPALDAWFPHAAVKALGFEVNPEFAVQMLATVGIDAHDDHIHGPVLILVLHNDGLTFVQGKHRHRTAVGEWFIFDDTKMHAVKETATTTAYVCMSVALRPLG